MTDKEKLIKLKKLADAMYYAAQYLTTDASRLHKAMNEYHKFTIHECKEEPVSEDLEKAAVEAFKQIVDSDKNNFLEIFKAGTKWQEEHLWKPADGNDLPEYEREVVVFTQNFPDDAGIMSIAIGHRPNPDGWDGKSLSTGKVEHYTPKTYDKGGWNIPDVVLWLDAELPKEIEL